MKPDPSSSSGENPPSERSDSGRKKRSKPVGDGDLWDFDHTEDSAGASPARTPVEESQERPDDEPAPAAIPMTPRGPRRDSIPFKQSPAKSKSLSKEATPGGNPDAKGEPAEPKRVGKPMSAERTPVEDTFDELEASLASHPELDEPAQEPPAEKEAPEKPEAAPKKSAASEDEPTDKKPTEPLPKEVTKTLSAGLSKIEKVGLISFLVLIVAGGLFFLAHSVSKLPEEKKSLTTGDFPIKGKLLEAVSFKSYWRDPITSGSDVDTVRRGTIILPVVELGVSGGPAAVRIFFRNSDGETVGDAVTRPVNGKAVLSLPATAGFEEPGMHAAYRTGDTKPWIVEVFEGPSTDAAGRDFKKLFEIPVSTHRR